MDIERYQVQDGLTLREVIRILKAGNTEVKIDLIKKLAPHDAIPLELAKIITSDSEPEIRRTLASYAHSMYYWPLNHSIGQKPEFDIAEVLRKDEDELVRCALYENPSFAFGVKDFSAASHIERLALVRNPEIIPHIIVKIYEPDDKDFNLADKERLELVQAYCTNRVKTDESKRDSFDFEFNEMFDDVLNQKLLGWPSKVNFYDNLWDAAFKWLGVNPEITRLTVRSFGASGKKVLEVYEKLKDKKYAQVRRAVFENKIIQDELRKEGYSELKKKGLEDEDTWIRYISAATSRAIQKSNVDELIQKGDQWTFRGLLFNRHLTLDSMRLLNSTSYKRKDFTDFEGEHKAFLERFSKREDVTTLDGEEAAEENFGNSLDQDPLDEFQKRLIAKVIELERRTNRLVQDLKYIKTRMLTGKKLFWYAVGFLLLMALFRSH